VPAAFDTAEFRRSDGPGFHNAVSAWNGGSTGAGVTIGIVDSGIETANPEFAGRISPDSMDFAGNGTIEAVDMHGTWVALVAAAARDGSGTVGIAYDATILALRTDDPGSCPDSCAFFDPAIASAVDHAVASGARVINISLGGGGASAVLTTAIANASAAGVVVVVSAGNDGAKRPDLFARDLKAAGATNVIIAGSVDSSGRFSSFSDRAGNGAYRNWYLTALGEDIFIQQGGSSFSISGTSFSAPQIAGAAALLAQAFPTLTGAEIVQILLESAFDAGAAGTDSTFGRGILDIAAAFAPHGSTSLAGSVTPITLSESAGSGSRAMGDALSGASLRTVVLDRYKRAYTVDFGRSLQNAQVAQRLANALGGPQQELAGGGPAFTYAFSIDASGSPAAGLRSGVLQLRDDDAQRARVLAGQVALRISPDTQLGFTISEGAAGLVAHLQGREGAAFLVTPHALSAEGFERDMAGSIALRRQFGRWGVTASAEAGSVIAGGYRDSAEALARTREGERMTSFGLAVDRRFGPVAAMAGLSWLNESGTVLGARLNEGFGGKGADTAYLDAQAAWPFARGWQISGAMRHGWTFARSSGAIAGGSRLSSLAWSIDLERQGAFSAYDRVGFRLSQPLRVESGGLRLNLPIAYDYVTQNTTYAIRQLNLAPRGRELMGELAWSGPLGPGSATASLFYRHEPGHYADMPADMGAAVNWRMRF